LKFGKWKNYFSVLFVIILMFVLIYALAALFGVLPDLSIQKFAAANHATLPIPGPAMAALIFLITITIAPIINAIAAFGEELGWRGYLLPKLLPLGETKALVLSGLIWGLWHAPLVLLIGFGNYPNRLLGAVLFTLVITCLGIYFGYLRTKSGSTILTSWAHGALNSQGYGVWVMLYWGVNPYLVGAGGVLSLFLSSLLAWYVLRVKVKEM
jgi:membrane protease YdiL (CAAX protease family)